MFLQCFHFKLYHSCRQNIIIYRDRSLSTTWHRYWMHQYFIVFSNPVYLFYNSSLEQSRKANFTVLHNGTFVIKKNMKSTRSSYCIWKYLPLKYNRSDRWCTRLSLKIRLLRNKRPNARLVSMRVAEQHCIYFFGYN